MTATAAVMSHRLRFIAEVCHLWPVNPSHGGVAAALGPALQIHAATVAECCAVADAVGWVSW